MRLKGGGQTNLRGISRKDRPNVDVTYNHVNELVSGSFSETIDVDDARYDRHTGAVYFYAGNISLTGMISPTIRNLNPELATIGGDGAVTRLQGGVCNVVVSGERINIPLTLDLGDKDEATTVDEYVAPVPGSLADTLASEVQTRITNGMTMEANGRVYTTQDHTTPNYVRNLNVWCADIASKLTCISPWNSSGLGRKAGALVTPRNAVFVVHAHYYPYVGDTWRFVEVDGTVHDREVTGVAIHPDYSPYVPDIAICTFESDLPASIAPCSVMPPDWSDYLVNNFHNRPPALGLDQEEKALSADFYGTTGYGAQFLHPIDADRLVFSEELIGGDSANPAFLIVDGELVLVTCWTFGGGGAGTPISDYISDINAMIVTTDAQAGMTTVDDETWPNADGHYKLKEADFSGFPSYG